MKTLNVIGAGRVGRTLTSLWNARGVFAVQDVLDGSIAGARAAVAFIGAGRAVESSDAMRASDVWMITTPDRSIASACERIASARLLHAGDVVFHCSGSLGSEALGTARAAGALAASVHPLMTFADPADVLRSFAGTHCACEGDPGALGVLRAAFEAIGARVAEIDARFKTIYHAASVFASNYLVALLETAVRCYERAGLDREAAQEMIAPIVRETVQNVFDLGSARALTGPIARGDEEVVASHLAAIAAWDVRVAALYRELGAVALRLARAAGEADARALDRIEALLDERVRERRVPEPPL